MTLVATDDPESLTDLLGAFSTLLWLQMLPFLLPGIPVLPHFRWCWDGAPNATKMEGAHGQVGA